MKTAILIIGILVCFVAAHSVMGQPSEGSIIYEVRVNVHRTIPQDRQDMKSVIPEFNSYKDQLVFRKGESLYKTLEEDEDEEFATEGGAVRMRFRRPFIEYYFKEDESKKLRAQEFFGKKYLIEDSLSILPWKLGTATRTIQGYVCKNASYFNEGRKQNIVVWYSDQLMPYLGPENYNSLPGTVLQVDINDGERVILASKVQFRSLRKGEIKVPASGQRITQREFEKIQAEQMQKMGAQGGMIIRTN